MLGNDRSYQFLQELTSRFADETYQPDMRDRADIEFVKAVSLNRIAEALEEINGRQRKAEREAERRARGW